jgi:hypothetical protein
LIQKIGYREDNARYPLRRVRRRDRKGTDKKTATTKQRKAGNGRLKNTKQEEMAKIEDQGAFFVWGLW